MLLTLFKLTLGLWAVFKCVCLKSTCPIPNWAWCFHFPLWPWRGTACSIWQIRDHTTFFFFFSHVWSHQNHKCIQDGAFIARNSIVVLTFVTMQRGFPQKQRKKKKRSVWLRWWFSCAGHADRVTLAPAIHLFLTVFMAARGEEARRAPTRWFVFQPVRCCLDISCCSNTGGCGWFW